MKFDIKITDNKLMINSKECILKNTISKFLEINDEVFVLLNIPFGKPLTEDDYFILFKLNSEGKIVWKASFKKPSSEFQCSPLVNIVLTDAKLTTVDFMGRQFEVDITTGQLKIIGFKNNKLIIVVKEINMTTEVINAIDKFITISNKYHIDGIASQINVLNELKTKLLRKSAFSEREKISLYQALFPSRGGLSDVNYWNDNFEKRKEVNTQLFEQKNIIANYLLGKR